jgi:soluble lytic murein transglycosylase-like protein
MDKQELVLLARAAATGAGLDPALVCAVVEQESAWDPLAIRIELGFYRKYVQAMVLSDTEKYARSFSWGLMQVMGQVAREHGFKGKYLSELCYPEVGLSIGCKVLKGKLEKAQGDVKKALLLWNGGGRPAYADEVLARIPKYS